MGHVGGDGQFGYGEWGFIRAVVKRVRQGYPGPRDSNRDLILTHMGPYVGIVLCVVRKSLCSVVLTDVWAPLLLVVLGYVSVGGIQHYLRKAAVSLFWGLGARVSQIDG